MTQLTYPLPVISNNFQTEAPKVDTALQQIQTVVNGQLDSGNLSAATAQSAGINAAATTVKGAVNIATAQSTSSTSYTTLSTPDQVTGIVLPANGLIAVWYQATWQESVAGAARAALFIGANQLKITDSVTMTAVTQAAATGAASNPNFNCPLISFLGGLASKGGLSVNYGGDATTGQAVGFNGSAIQEINGGSPSSVTNPTGPCYIFAAAGTYTIGVQFKASSGSVTASNRKLWVSALSFS